jgi:Ca2+-transporting ATPase
VASLAIGLYQTFGTAHNASNPPVEWVEGVAIIVAIVIIVLVSSVNDWEKSRQFKKLNEKQLEQDAKVVRFGVSTLISSSDVLVGDVVYLEPGDVIPADGILISGHNVMCDESSATGESELVLKTPGDDVYRAWDDSVEEFTASSQPGLDPFILSGTKVLEGVGTFLVTATGVHSNYGKILSQLRDESDPTPLQDRLAILAKYISRIGMLMFLLLFVALFIRFLVALPHDHRTPTEKGKNFVDILIISLTVLVIAVPEGLPLAVTLSLAFATKRMLKEHNLVRELKACETMGNATSVCSDKTGTLTQNQMTVVAGMVGQDYHFYDRLGASTTYLPLSDDTLEEKYVPSPTEFARGLDNDMRNLLLQSIALNTTAFESKLDGSFVGSTTESALLNFARDYLSMGPVAEERSKENIVQLIPFSGARKCMATVIKLRDSPGTYRVFIKGAAETLLSQSTRIIHDPTSNSSDVELSSEDGQRMGEIIKSYASQALRMIGFAYSDFQVPQEQENTAKTPLSIDYVWKDLIFLGVMGIHDGLRPGVWESVKDCQKAGVTVRMVTGDNLQTAKAIAKECGILSSNVSDIAMESSEFRRLGEYELRKVVPDLKVLARSSPEDKQRLVVLLKEMGEIVAVTGDGTNDASAMSAADVSFSMGLTGTEVARQASSIIMMTDDFTCIVGAIMWGRAVNDSVKKFLQVSILLIVQASTTDGANHNALLLVPNHYHRYFSAARFCILHLELG